MSYDRYLLQKFSQFSGGLADVHKVAIAAARARPFVELAATSLSKISNGRVLTRQHASTVEAPVEVGQRALRLLLVLELNVHIAHHVVAEVLAHLNVFNFTKLLQFFVHFFIKLVELQEYAVSYDTVLDIVV